MSDGPNVFVFSKKEVALILFIFMIATLVFFVLGVKIGKKFSYEKAQISNQDVSKLKLLSESEEKAESLLEEASKSLQKEGEPTKPLTTADLAPNADELNETLKSQLQEHLQEVPEQPINPAPPQEEKKEEKNIRNPSSVTSAPISGDPLLYENKEHLGKYAIQLASFPKASEAEEFAEKIKLKGGAPLIHRVTSQDKRIWFRVNLGPFKTIQEAKNFLQTNEILMQGQDFILGKFD